MLIDRLAGVSDDFLGLQALFSTIKCGDYVITGLLVLRLRLLALEPISHQGCLMRQLVVLLHRAE